MQLICGLFSDPSHFENALQILEHFISSVRKLFRYSDLHVSCTLVYPLSLLASIKVSFQLGRIVYNEGEPSIKSDNEEHSQFLPCLFVQV